MLLGHKSVAASNCVPDGHKHKGSSLFYKHFVQVGMAIVHNSQ